MPRPSKFPFLLHTFLQLKNKKLFVYYQQEVISFSFNFMLLFFLRGFAENENRVHLKDSSSDDAFVQVDYGMLLPYD